MFDYIEEDKDVNLFFHYFLVLILMCNDGILSFYEI